MDPTEADPLANLSEQQINTLFSFSDVTQIEDTNLCRSILAQNQWNLDVAVDNFINNRTGDGSGGGSGSSSGSGGFMGSGGTPVREEGSSGSGGGGGGILELMTSPLKWLFQTTPLSLSPDQDVSKFIDKFHIDYGRGDDERLLLERTSYAQAVRKAHREAKFLVVYLHSPFHDDTKRFCSQVLHSESVRRLLNGCNTGDESDDPAANDNNHASSGEVVTWAGQVWDPEAYNLSIDLQATTFPFVALLVCQSERSVRVLDRIQGFIDSDSLCERLQHSITATRTEIDRIRNEQIARSAEANLRVEQDREYLEAMETDRQQQLEAQRQREAQERAAEEEAQRKEMEEALALSAQLSRESALTKKRETLQRATPSGSDSAVIRFQLPQGIKISQTFWKTDPVEILYDFLAVHFADNDIPITNFMVSTNFPKKDLTDKSQTLVEVGLHPRGALFVHNLDS
jgi:FAS-associated factor 2